MQSTVSWKSLLISPIVTASLVVAVQTGAFAHAGHGDEFQAEGNIQRVQVNPETDQMLGITVTPIAAGAGKSVMVPATALVEADGQKIAFVKFENFYEPVPVTTGATNGDQIEVTAGLSVGEQLVTQGGLSLYSESLKAKGQSEATAAPETTAAQADQASADAAHAKAHAEGKAHSHDAAGLPIKKYAVAVLGAGVLFAGGIFAAMSWRKQSSTR